MAGSGIVSATRVRPARGVIAQPAGPRPGIEAVAVPGEQGARGPTAGQPTFTATTPLSGHKAVYARPDGTLALASADNPASADAFIGLTANAASPGASVTICTEGPMDEPSWSWAPGALYLGLDGTLTQTDPTTLPGAVIIFVVATAVSATRILVSPEAPVRFAA